MRNKPIIIVAGEPKGVFFEIFFKSLKKNKFRSPLILIASRKLLEKSMRELRFKKQVRLLNFDSLKETNINNNAINLIDVKFNKRNSSLYIKDSFDIAFKILKKKFTNKFINGPVNKTKFLNKKFLGITEFISKKFNVKKNAMLIFSKDLSVCPVTTHLPIKLVTTKINKKIIEDKVLLINEFFRKNSGFKPKIAVTGLNPHCESILKFNEDEMIISPVIKKLKNKGIKIFGPFPADTIFLKQNRERYHVILGMYHDQVLSPMKTLKEYDAINITLGLPFYRISPDHGPNERMVKQNLSSPLSLINAIKFLDKR